MIEIETTSPPVPPPALVTVRTAVAESMPPNPGMLAVIVDVPADTAVASPEELMVATAVVLDPHDTRVVTSSVVEG
jgi:hypothetical protein